jgi:heme-degrading monooxygenase HmoA
MQKTIKMCILASIILLLNTIVRAQQTENQQSKTEKNMQVILIDKLTVPVSAKEEFIKRMNANRAIIQKQPGFIKDEFFEPIDVHGDLIYYTMATWENQEAFQKARQAVQAEYQREGFDMMAFVQKFNIKIERGAYHSTGN